MSGNAHTEIEKTTLFEELCDINTLFGYVGLSLFQVNLYLCMFWPFTTGFHMDVTHRSVLFIAMIAGMVVASGVVFAIKSFTDFFHKNYCRKRLSFLILVLELVYPLIQFAAALTGWFLFPFFVVCATLFGMAAALLLLSWELISWKLQIWSFSRFLCMALLGAAIVVVVVELAVAEQWRIIFGCIAVIASVLLYYTIGEGKRSEYIIERDDSVAHLFTFDKHVDISYFSIQAVCGAAVAILCMHYHHFFLCALVIAAVLLVVFLFLFGSKRSFTGKFLQREIRGYASICILMLCLLMVPLEEVMIVALCILAAAWFTQWVFQGIFLERILGFGPTSVFFVSVSNAVNNFGFLVGIVFAVVAVKLTGSYDTVYLILLVVGTFAILAAMYFLPFEAAPTFKHPEEIQDELEPAAASAPAVDNLTVFLSDRAAELSETYLLSPRESDVLRYLARGSSAKYIANQLGISDHTVRVHVCHIYEKMGVHSKQALMALFDEGRPE